MQPRRTTTTLALLLLTFGAASAHAELAKCQRTIAKESAKFFQATAKATDACENAVVKSGGGTCPDAKMTSRIEKASAKLDSALAKHCGGSDKTCNADAIDEDLPGALGWPETCPNIATEHCDGPISSCAGIATCLACLATKADGSSNDLAYGALALPSTGDPDLNACQRAIGKANATYLRAESKALANCWAKRLSGAHSNSCEPPALGDGKYLDAIAKADAKRSSTIAKACGGADNALGGGDDVTPAAIGFAATCPAATVPGGPACSGAITDLTSIVTCLDCLADATVACVDRAGVPQLAAYPPECASCLSPPMSGPCPTTIALMAAGNRVDLDLGWTGFVHDKTLPSDSGVTLAVSGCAGTNHPTCGECTIAGPITGAGGPSAASARCENHMEDSCTADADCKICLGGTNADAACTTDSECPGGGCDTGPCVFFLGPPQDLIAGFPFCILNEITGPVSGTLNLTTGNAAAQLDLRARLFGSHCPTCVAGVCAGGVRDGEACVVQGTGVMGNDVSLDCPPNPLATAGTVSGAFALTTGQQTRAVTVDSPQCRQTGYTSLKCLCDTCNNDDRDACMTNADCPASGGAPGICGGRRCIGGSEAGKPCNVCLGGANHGATCSNSSACPGGSCSVGCSGACGGGPNELAPCTTNSQCPGATCNPGQCNRPGESTQPNYCSDDTSTPGLDCVPTSNGEGECAAGPVEGHCSVDTFLACGIDADCTLAGGCADCTTSDQTCVLQNLSCFTDNGVVGSPVVVVGKPGVPCAGTARPTLGGFSCTSPVAATVVNTIFGLPGLSRVRIPMEFVP